MKVAEEELLIVAEAFHTHLNFPSFIGPMDGKNVQLKCSVNSESYYFNSSILTIISRHLA